MEKPPKPAPLKPAKKEPAPTLQRGQPPPPPIPAQSQPSEPPSPALATLQSQPSQTASPAASSRKPESAAIQPSSGSGLAASAESSNPLTWVSGAVSSVAGFFAGGLGSVANWAAEVNVGRARDMVKPFLERALDGSVEMDPPLDKNFGWKGEDGFIWLSFRARGESKEGLVRLEAAVVPGGKMEIRMLTLDGKPVDMSEIQEESILMAAAAAESNPATTVIDIEGSS